MRTRRSGHTGHETAELGVGMWGVAGWTGTDEAEAAAAAAALQPTSLPL